MSPKTTRNLELMYGSMPPDAFPVDNGEAQNNSQLVFEVLPHERHRFPFIMPSEGENSGTLSHLSY